MPRYFFRLTDGRQVLKHHEPDGLDLPGNAAAREEAVVIARDLKHGKETPGDGWEGWFIRIVDQHGHQVDEVSIADVPEVS